MAEIKALNRAEAAAELARQRIYRCIDERKSFLVEAGAGAGKTFSLISALKYLIETQGRLLMRCNQRVACITYTNVSNDEIKARTDRHPAIQAETIHSFCWSAIRPFQSTLRKIIPSLCRWPERLEPEGGIGSRAVDYNLGYPSVDDSQVLLHHNDVLALTVALLGESKFRRVLAERYPVLLIDEYQDTDKDFASAILTHFVATGSGPLVGFFGDHWQKIYGEGCGKIEHPKLEVIQKEANFRSAPAIVDVLNRMRPELPQEVRNPAATGSAAVYHTNTWSGKRLTGPHNKGDLPPDVSHEYLDIVKAKLAQDGWDLSPDKTKILMLTHKVLANEQGYRQLADVFSGSESYIKKEDTHIAFFVDIVEPICTAYEARRYGEMFHFLGEKRPTITTLDDKATWKRDIDTLVALRANATVGEVMEHLRTSKLRLPNAVQRREERLSSAVPENEEANEKLRSLLKVPYRQVSALARFLHGHTPFETKHGVKGAEFENVLVVIGRGWNHYDFNRMLTLTGAAVPAADLEFFERNRNLFYVACSRPQVNLALLFTQALAPQSLAVLTQLFGCNGIHSLQAIAAR